MPEGLCFKGLGISKSPDLGQKPPDSRKNFIRLNGKKKKEDFGDFTEELFLVGK